MKIIWLQLELFLAKFQFDSMIEVAKTFNGVEHRAEFVREVDGVRYYNDSIASSPTRTARGTLSLFNRKNNFNFRWL